VRATVLYFAAARERAGLAREELELSARTVRDALRELVARHPALEPLSPHVRIAVNQAFAQLDDPLPEAGELALIPPVAGG
jgi:molybdopterin converting factor subunit 1